MSIIFRARDLLRYYEEKRSLTFEELLSKTPRLISYLESGKATSDSLHKLQEAETYCEYLSSISASTEDYRVDPFSGAGGQLSC